MAKKKHTEKKFRWLKLALSINAYANIERISRRLKVSRSRVITIMLDGSPLEVMELLDYKLKAGKLENNELENDALRIRNSKPEDLGDLGD